MTIMTPIRDRPRDALWREAMQTEELSGNTIRRRLGTVHRIEAAFGRDVADLDMDDVTGWLAQYDNPTTRACYLGDLEAHFAWRLLRAEHLDDQDAATFRSPVRGIKKPKQPERLPRPITTDELYAGLDAASGDLRDQILLGAYQACRVGDAASVAGEHVSGRSLRLPFGKGKKDRTIPLHDELLAVAARRPRRGYWFPGRGRSGHITAHTIGENVTAHFTKLGVVDFTYHRLRHWCGTEMLRAGADLRYVQEFMRHANISTTVLYTKVLQEELAAAAALLPRRANRPAADAG